MLLYPWATSLFRGTWFSSTYAWTSEMFHEKKGFNFRRPVESTSRGSNVALDAPCEALRPVMTDCTSSAAYARRAGSTFKACDSQRTYHESKNPTFTRKSYEFSSVSHSRSPYRDSKSPVVSQPSGLNTCMGTLYLLLISPTSSNVSGKW